MASKRVSALFTLLWLIVALSAPVFGVPANSKVWTFTQPDGTKFQAVLRGDEFYSYHETLEGDIIQRDPPSGQWRYARPRGSAALEITSVPVGKGNPPEGTKARQMTHWLEAVENAADRTASRMVGAPGAARAAGTVRGVLLLANFRDTKTEYAPSDFNDLMNATGGVKDYYLEASYGKLTLQIDVYGWLSLPNACEYYGRNIPNTNNDDPVRRRQMILDAIKEADPNVDFSKYDGDGDGWVDLLGVVHQGQGQEQSGAHPDCIWSSAGSLNEPETVDGVRISAFFTAPERFYERLTTIGIYCHEIGHIFRLPDLYDSSDPWMSAGAGVGDWSVMGSGNWLGWLDRDGSRPCHFDPWCKYVLGWVTPEVIDTPRSGIVLPSFDTHPTVLLIPIDPYQDGEYFLVANRYGRQGGFDEYLPPWPGVLILHVDDYVPNNNNEVRKKVDVEEADGLRELDTGANYGDAGDLYMWPESVFDDASEPNSRDNNGISTGITIRNFTVAEDVGTVTCDVTPQTFLNGYSIFYDSMGFLGHPGLGYPGVDGDDYACVRFQADRGGILERVKTYFVYDGKTDYTVSVYSGWAGNKPTELLTQQLGSHTGIGYEEIVLREPQPFAEGAEFAVEIRYNTAGGTEYPIPIENDGDWSGRSYTRYNATVAYTQQPVYDILIRADLRPLVEFAGGTGEPNDPYQVATAQQLISIASAPYLLNKHFALVADIDLDPNELGGKVFDRAVIAPDTNDLMIDFQGDAFSGSFDGNGHAIRNLVIHASAVDFVGLFGYLGGAASVQNLNLDEIDISGDRYVGALAGYSEATVQSCSVHGTVAGGWDVGGLVGYHCGNTISSCSSAGTVRGTGLSVGGLVGYIIPKLYPSVAPPWVPSFGPSHVTSCYSTASVEGLDNVGGLIGDVRQAEVGSSFSTGNVTGNGINPSFSEDHIRKLGERVYSGVGGLLGSSIGGFIHDCYSTGNVKGMGSAHLYGISPYIRGRIGGLVGWSSSRLDSCYARGTVTGTGSYVGGLIGQDCPVVEYVPVPGGSWTTCTYNSRVDFCYSTGSVIGLEDLYSKWHPILEPATTEIVQSVVGGLIGEINTGYSDTVELPRGCFWDTEASGQAKSDGGTGKTTAEMQTASTFLDAGWDFLDETKNGSEDIWWILEGKDYPRLWWEAAGQ